MSLHFLNNAITTLSSTIKREQTFCFLVFIAAIGAITPHPANITPIAALGLFAGAYMRRKLFLLVPIAALLVADLSGSGFYDLKVMSFVYLGMFASSLTGRYLLATRPKLGFLPTGIILSSLAFFLLSNTGNWWAYYPLTAEGLRDCMINGMPYFFRTLLGNTLWSLVFFGSYEWLKSHSLLQPA